MLGPSNMKSGRTLVERRRQRPVVQCSEGRVGAFVGAVAGLEDPDCGVDGDFEGLACLLECLGRQFRKSYGQLLTSSI